MPKEKVVKLDATQRGFARGEFKDRNGEKCSIQKSSIATEDCIWLGINDCKPQVCVPGEGWKPVPFPHDTLFTTRMHLNKKQVAALIPLLQRFVETGDVSEIKDAWHIDVFVDYNDTVDVKAGGSPTLGYDFYVDAEEFSEKKAIAMVKKCLDANKQKFQRVIARSERNYNGILWTEKRISDCIAKNPMER